ncbi:MAG: PA14 domain-containing protein [Akkermansiaceae bacterium]
MSIRPYHLILLSLCLLSLSPHARAKEFAKLPVLTEFFDAATGKHVLDSRQDRLPAYYGKAGQTPSALTPAGVPWKAQWKTVLKVPAKDEYVFELRGSGSASIQVSAQSAVSVMNQASAPLELAAGDHPLVIHFTPPAEGVAQLRLFWKSSAFGWEPVAATSLKQPESSIATDHALIRSQRQLIVENRCNACHTSEDNIALPEAGEMGPSLAGIGSRLDEAWMARWIQNPEDHRPGTRMPALFHGPEAAQKSADIAAYLASMKAKKPKAGNKGNKDAGAKLYKALNCYACHDMHAVDSIERIPLVNVSRKYKRHALASFLQNPGEHHEATRMPDFKLNKQQAADLAAFLFTLKQSPEPTAPEPLPRGDAARGKTLLTQSGCMNCHDAPGHQNEAKFSSLTAMLKAPAGSGCLAPEGPQKKAPHFSADLATMGKVEAGKVTASLKQDHPAEYAHRQFEALNCMACHSRDGMDASRLMRVEEVAHIDISDPKAHSHGPEKLPALDHFGHKLRADWMAELFAGTLPEKTRPWLQAQMPAWPSRAGLLATGFAHSYGVGETHLELREGNTKTIKTGQALVSQQGFSCQACHALGNEAALAVFEGAGPNLALATKRLRPDYYHQWMHYPQRFDAATIMPRYATNGVTPLKKYYDGDADKQFKAIYDYLQDLASKRQVGFAPGLIGEYFKLREGLGSTPAIPDTEKPWLVRIDPQVNFPNTGKGFYGVKLQDDFIARWRGKITAPEDGNYIFYLGSDDGSCLKINGKEIINFWGAHSYKEHTARIQLKAGQHDIELTYLELRGQQGCVLSWTPPSGNRPVIPASQFSHKTEQYDAIAWNPKPWQKAPHLINPKGEHYDKGIPARYGSLVGAPFRINKDSRGDNDVFRAHAVPLSDDGNVGVVFDTDTMRLAATFAHGGIKFEGLPFTGAHGSFPSFAVPPFTSTGSVPGWASADGTLSDPRLSEDNYYPPLGTLPKDWAHYKGAYRHGKKVIFHYTVGDTKVLEHHALKSKPDEQAVISRILELAPHEGELTLVLADAPKGSEQIDGSTLKLGTAHVHVLAKPDGATLSIQNGQALLRIPANDTNTNAEILYTEADNYNGFEPSSVSLGELCQGGPAQWPDIITTQGETAKDENAAYVVDRLGLPNKNPYTGALRVAAFDFFADGSSAAVCTWDGDVWIVKNIDAGLGNLQWKLFARGIHEPLGLRIVDEKVYTVSDDQITRYHDLNGDGEADYYENFNNDWQLTSGFHAFAFDLVTDSEGNFYFALGMPVRGGGRGFERVSEHHGTILKVSKDGSKLSKYASGFRAPNGIGISPDGQVTSGDNEGTFVPRSPINWVKEGGFYGVVDSYDKRDELKTTAFNEELRQGREQHHDPSEAPKPLVWMPKKIDNSGGGQVWVTSNRWGPLQGELLHGSYGMSTLYLVLKEEIEGQIQGGVVKVPVSLNSSNMRMRFNDKDGQLYVMGLKGWQTNAGLLSSFDRVRYTGKPIDLPTGLEAQQDGLIVRFSEVLDPASANQAENYSLSGADIHWCREYGTQEFHLKQRELPLGQRKKGWTDLKVTGAELLGDGKSVKLSIEGLIPAHMLELNLSLSTEDGRPIKTKINHTIHQLK